MNERIQELAEQAGWDMGDEVCGFTNRLERFYELTINQCAEFVEQDQGSGDCLAKRLKNHFGVE